MKLAITETFYILFPLKSLKRRMHFYLDLHQFVLIALQRLSSPV